MKKKFFISTLLALLAVAAMSLFVACSGGGAQSTTSEEKECTHENLYEVVMEPTCEKAGQRHTTCKDCGEIFAVETIEPLGHLPGEADVIEATCSAPKTYVSKCMREGCVEYIETTEGEPLGHNYEVIKEIPANCTDPEKAEVKCSRCSIEKIVVVEGGDEACGHNYVHVGDEEATCMTVGYRNYECENCQDKYSDVLPANGHTSDGITESVVAPTCVDKGYTVLHCAKCGEDYRVNFTSATGHSLEEAEFVDASCSSVGYRKCQCTNAGCSYYEMGEIAKNTSHSFDENGTCTVCNHSAVDAFAIKCGEATPFAILKNGNVYNVYSESYKEETIFMPAEVIQALYASGVYSFNISMGSNEGRCAISLSLKIQGGAIQYINAGQNELKAISSYTFADENGVFAEAKNGVTFDVYYRPLDDADASTGKDKLSCYAIRFEYVLNFDINNSRSYINTGLTYTYNAVGEGEGTFTVTDIKLGGFNYITVRKELLAYYREQGYDSLYFTISTPNTQKGSFDGKLTSNGILKGNKVGNLGLAFAKIDLTAVVCKYDMELTLYITDLTNVPEWKATEQLDTLLFGFSFKKSAEAASVSIVAGEDMSGASVSCGVNDKLAVDYFILKETVLPENVYTSKGKKVGLDNFVTTN